MKRFVLFASILLTGIFVACGSTTTPVPKANLRVLHALPDAGVVDVLLDDKKFLTNFLYKEAIAFNQVDAGKRNIKVNATGVTTASLINDNREFVEGRYYTVIAADTSAIDPLLVIDEDNGAPPAGKLRVKIVHAASAAPAVDIYVFPPSETLTVIAPVVQNVAFKSSSPALDIAAGDYIIRINAAGTNNVLFDSGSLPLSAGANLMLVAVQQNTGSKSPISLVNLTRNISVFRSDIFDINAQIRLVHAAPDVAAVDLQIKDKPAQSALSYGTASAYLPVVSGPNSLKVYAAGTTTNPLASTDTSIPASSTYSLYLMGFAASLQNVLVADFLSPPSAGNANLRIVHASPDTVGLDVFQDDSTTAALTALPKAASSYLIVPAGAHTYKFNLTGTANAALPAQTLTLQAGKIYTAVVIGSSVAGAAKPLELRLITDR